MTGYLVRGAPRLVEAWSATRLAFEPRGWQVAFRDDLRAATRQLEVAPSEVLHAAYGSADRTGCDAENVLFYNVGQGAFAAAMRNGVRFERGYSLPADDAAVGAAHYHRYEPAAPEAGWRWWRRGKSLRRWTDLPWPATTTNPTTRWWGRLLPDPSRRRSRRRPAR